MSGGFSFDGILASFPQWFTNNPVYPMGRNP
jgi:hypothetical protein